MLVEQGARQLLARHLVAHRDADALGGDKLRLYFNDLAAITRPIHVTTHRIVSPRAVVLDIVSKMIKAGATA